MTQREQLTLQDLALKFDAYVHADIAWKKEVTDKLDPIVEERNERIVLQKAGKYVWKGVGAIIVFLGSVGILVHYLPEILRAFRLK